MKTVPVRRVAAILNGGTPTTSEVNWGGNVPWATPVDLARVDGRAIATTDRTLTVAGLQSGSAQAPAGAVIVSTRAPIGYTARAEVPIAFNQGCKAVLGHTEVHPRFLQLALIAATSALKAAGSGSTFLELSSEALASQPIPMYPLDQQRRITGFLDDRVARIDRIIAARREQMLLVEGQEALLFHEVLGEAGVKQPLNVERGWSDAPLPNGWRATTLGSVLRQMTNGYVGPTRDILVDAGVRYIQSVHIKQGRIDFSRRPFFVSEEWHAARPRINLRDGDVLIVQTGAIGQVAVVPEDFGEASCHALLIARTAHKLVHPEYLGEMLRSRFGYSAMLARATGALHPHLEAGVRTVPIVIPSLATQRDIVGRVSAARSKLDSGVQSLTRSIDLLTEYKTSLITAAVTGELDVTTSGSGVPA